MLILCVIIFGLVMVAGMGIIDFFRWFFEKVSEKIRIARKQKHEKEIEELSPDTQIILKQYMSREYTVFGYRYVVENVKMFDYLLKNHLDKQFKGDRAHCFDDCIKECLNDGSGFIIIMNGEEYVAVPPLYRINPDDMRN